MRSRKIWKTLLAYVCVITLVAGCFTGLSFVSRAEDKEITFSDFGLSNQTITSNTTTQGTLSGHTSFDGLTFHGYASFSGNSDFAVLKFGDKIDIFQQGGAMYVRYNDGSEKYIVFGGYETYNQEIEIWLGFKYVGNDVELTFKVDDKEAQTRTLSGMADDLSTKLLVWAPGSIKIKSVEKQTEEPKEQEITFSDFGLSDQTITSNTTTQGTLSGHTSFDGLTFHGYASFSNNSDFAVLKFGDKIDIFQQTGCMYVRYNDGSEKFIAIGGYDTFNQEVEIWLGFKYVGNDVELTFKVDDKEAQTRTLSGMADDLSTKLLVWAPGSIKIKSVEKQTEEPKEQEITFSDFGLSDQTITSNTTTQGTLSGHTSFDGLTFHGYASFSNNSDFAVLKFGDKIDIFQQGGAMYVRYNDGSEKFIAIGGYDTYNQEVEIWLGFKYVGNDVELTFKVDDKEAQTRTLSGMANALSTKLLVWAPGSLTIKSVGQDSEEQPPEDNTPYTELTFKDYKYENGPITSGRETHKLSNNMENMHRTAISGQVSFKGNSDQNWLSIAEKATGMGICIYQQNDVVWAEDRTGKGEGFLFSKENVQLGIENEDFITFRMTFDIAQNGDVTLALWLNEQEIGTKVVTGYAQYLGTEMTVFGIGTSYPTIVVSTGETYTAPDDNDKSYREITFWDYKLRDGKVTTGEKKGEAISDLASLDKVAFVGKISFKDNSDRNWLRIAQNKEGKGITLFQQFGSVYLRDDTALSNGSTLIFGCENKTLGVEQGDMMNVRITFDYKKDGSVTLNLWLNDYYVGQSVMKDYAQYLGTGITVFGINVDFPTDIESVGKKAPLSSYALWEIFLTGKVNMKYYGFTNENWKRELDTICK